MKNEKFNEGTESLIKNRVITFNKPFEFECKPYHELDLSGLDDLTTKDLMAAEKIYTNFGGTSLNPEATLTYSIIIAQRASGKPFEFFDALPTKEALKIKKAVYNFFYREG